MRVAVVGAGITGLSAALALRDRGMEVTVFEAATRAGGVITSERCGDWLVEAGPTSVMATPALETLLDRLNLTTSRIASRPESASRFIARQGRLVPLPRGLREFVTTDALSRRAKLALLREPLVRARRDNADESLAALVRRRLNDDILATLVDPLVAGVYAGDPERLSARHAMPTLVHAERTHGSLLLGVLRTLRARRRRLRQPGLISFVDGLETLPKAIAAELDGALRLGTRVVGIRQRPVGWELRADGDHGGTHDADAIIVAVRGPAIPTLGLPAEHAADIDAIAAVEHQSIATLALGFRREDVTHPLDGFGVLTPSSEKRSVLGVVFASSVFARRAPDGHVLLTCYLGGARDPALGRAPIDAALPRALHDLRELLGVRGEPIFVRHTRWADALPQYALGHERVLAAAERIEATSPGITLAGSWRAGTSVGDCVDQGQLAAERAERAVGQRIPIIIGTRGSALALWQANHIRTGLLGERPDLHITLERITTRGDVVQDRPLAEIGRSALFVAEIEEALRSGRIRLAVHSAKDLPSTLPSEFAIVAFTTRADPRDVLVSKCGTLAELPSRARVGTSSPRRACQLVALRPDLSLLDLRGNVDTRLAKLDRGEYDAIVLAAAGLERLGLSHRITECLDPDLMLPAVGQGILAVEARADDADIARLCAAFDDADARACAVAERAFLAAMGAGCNAPLAGFATLDGDTLTLSALVGTPEGRTVRLSRSAPRAAAAALGAEVASALMADGGAELLAAAVGADHTDA